MDRNKKIRRFKYGCDQKIKLFSKAINISLRVLPPVYHTTPIPILHCEGGIPQIKILSDEKKLIKALQIQNLDLYYLMRRREYSNTITRLTKVAYLLPISMDVELTSLDEELVNLISTQNLLGLYFQLPFFFVF